MLKKRIAVLAVTLITVVGAYAQVVTGNARYVDPFIGVDGGGNVFPGACAPFGMVKLGPDCGNKDWNAGWNPNDNIHGFSHTHVSGTGLPDTFTLQLREPAGQDGRYCTLYPQQQI